VGSTSTLQLLESDYGPLFGKSISQSAMQFLYVIASEILDREVGAWRSSERPCRCAGLPPQVATGDNSGQI